MREFYEPPIPRPYLEPRSQIGRLQRAWYAPTRWIKSTVTRTQDRRNVRAARHVLTNSLFSAESLARAYGVQAHVVYLGVDVEKFHPLDLPRGDFVLSVGALSPLKGYDFLILALAKIPETERPRLVIAGNTASVGERLYLQRLADENRVAVEFRIDVTDEELVRLYSQAQALVYAPILEPFGFAPLEAMACGTPVIAVREGGVRESVVDGVTGWLVSRDAESFAQALARVLSDGPCARQMGESGRKQVLEFWTWDRAYGRLTEELAAAGMN